MLEKISILSNEAAQIRSEIDLLLKPTPTDPVQWTGEIRILKGTPFSFENRDYLLPIYRDTAPRLIVVKSRQMEMTEWAVNWLLHNLLTHPFTTAIYTAPRMDQVSRFSQDRFRKAILDAPKLRDILVNDRKMIMQINGLRYQVTKAGNLIFESPEKERVHDDYLWALALAIYRAREPPAVIQPLFG